jgi:SAM-dependent methyltransferase
MSALSQPVTPAVSAQPGPEVSPLFFFQHINAYQQTATLMAALELDVFTQLAEATSPEERTVQALARKIKASEKGTRVLCDFLTVQGLLVKHDAEGPYAWYQPTRDAAAYLDRRSPQSLANAPKFLAPPPIHGAAEVVTASVRKGGTVTEERTNENAEMWVEFARSMAPFTSVSAGALSSLVDAPGPRKMLDVAASHGLFGIACLKRNPQARVVALDGASVLEVGEENAKKTGVADRWSKLVGDAFTVDLGTGYDAALVTNFLHHFTPEENERFLRRIHAALKPGGKVAVLEFVPNEDRVTPPVPASFALIMLMGTVDGDAYTYRQLSAMLERAGFRGIERHDTEGSPQTIVIAHRT